MTQGLLLLGGGGLAREAFWYAREIYPTVVFYDDVTTAHELAVGRVRGAIVHDFATVRGLPFVAAVGDPALKRVLVRRALEAGLVPAPTLVHSTAWRGGDVELGPGGIVAPGARLTTNVHVGSYCLVGVNVAVGHDARLGDFVTANPGCQISGNVDVGEGSLVGTGASVRERIRIGPGVTVGASACVVRDLLEPGTYVGVPARRLSPRGA